METGPGVAVVSGVATLDVTSVEADAVGVGGLHGAEKGKGRVSPSGRKIWPASPLEWETDRGGGQGLRSGGKPREVSPGSWRGSRVAEGHRHPQSRSVAPVGRNLRSDPRGRRCARGRRTGSGRGQKLPSHPKHQWEQQHQLQRVDGERSGAGAVAELIVGNGRV